MSNLESYFDSLLAIARDLEIEKQQRFLTPSQQLRQMLEDPNLLPDQRASLLLIIERQEELEALAIQTANREACANFN